MGFGKKTEKWVNLGVIFSEKKLENIQSFMIENNISYKCKPELNFGMNNNLWLNGLSNVTPTWRIYVMEQDMYRVMNYIGTGCDL